MGRPFLFQGTAQVAGNPAKAGVRRPAAVLPLARPMLITASFPLGLFVDLWWLPAFRRRRGRAGPLARSPPYRRQLAEVPGAKAAAVVATGMLTALCVGAFFARRLWQRHF